MAQNRASRKRYRSLIVWIIFNINSLEALKRIYQFTQLVWFEQAQKQTQHKASG